ncbi:hypothetical protein C5B96_09795 [Subtercola sp. Z020]|uniref:hypothetical protein n=1 Tax=Subtercola sp. Z020 TaxID=2080582 RepID=UPI000CE7DC79|nr:hypothetical protein [Subtercola sp. Z020]PPF82236.1 hypothetical protein C5B96_09795 [Subtercola sp. Z020]
MRRRLLVASAVVFGALVIFATLRIGSFISISVGLLVLVSPLLLLAAVRRPQLYCWFFGIVLGASPFITLPGTGTQLVFFLAIAVLILGLGHATARRREGRSSTIALWMAITIAACFLSMVATFTGFESVNQWVRWALASVLVCLGVWMSPTLRIAVSRAFVVGCSLGAVLSIILSVVDKTGSFVQSLTFVGYGGAGSPIVRTVEVSGSLAVRATGLYTDPNTAGLFFVMALGVAAFVYTGVARALTMIVLTIGTAATLSRSAILSVIFAALVVLLVQNQSAIRRIVIGVIFGAGLVSLALVPSISGRLSGSFSDSDVGAKDRLQAYVNYPGQLEGHWLFGRGWALREFTDSYYGYLINHVANTPLLVVYRGGIIAGIAFLVLLIVGVVASVRGLRSKNIGFGMMGAVFIGLVLIAFELDFPVVTMPPLAMGFSILLMNLGVAGADPLPPPASGRSLPTSTAPKRREVYVP